MKPEEIPAGAAVSVTDARRRSWTAPSTRRLATSAAESNAAGATDLAELLS